MNQSKSKAMEKYREHAENAVQAYHNGQYRKSADEYLLAFQICPMKTELNMWQILHGYISILNEKWFTPTQNDRDALKAIRDDHLELKLYRVQAGFTLALFHYDMGNRFDTAEGYREVLRIGEKKSKPDDKEKMLEIRTRPDGSSQIELKPMDDITNDILEQCQKNLDQLTSKKGWNPKGTFSQLPTPRMRSDGTPVPDSRRKIFSCYLRDGILMEDEFDELVKVSGCECDYCKKSDVKLSLCSKCKMAFYCSRVCQKKQWMRGHQKYCRKDGEFQTNDYAILYGLKSKPELNGTMVKIVGPADKPGRLEVAISFQQRISVLSENLRRVRPLDCLEKFVSSSAL